MKAIRAKIGKLTKVAAIKASEVLQSVKIDANGHHGESGEHRLKRERQNNLLVHRSVERRGHGCADHEINSGIDKIITSHANGSDQLLLK